MVDVPTTRYPHQLYITPQISHLNEHTYINTLCVLIYAHLLSYITYTYNPASPLSIPIYTSIYRLLFPIQPCMARRDIRPGLMSPWIHYWGRGHSRGQQQPIWLGGCSDEWWPHEMWKSIKGVESWSGVAELFTALLYTGKQPIDWFIWPFLTSVKHSVFFYYTPFSYAFIYIFHMFPLPPI